MAPKISVAANVGFCAGVQRAVMFAKKAAAQYGRVAMLGDIVHNELVVRELAALGVEIFQNLADIPVDVPVIFRSHGTPAAIWEQAKARGLQIIDATCPLVKKIHQEVKSLAAEQRQIIIIGDHGHEEVAAIASQVNGAIIIANAEEAEQLGFYNRLGVVIQSTQDLMNVKAVISVLVAKTDDLHLVNTICQPTRQRQEQIIRLASENDVMLIIGSQNSANTRRLAAIAREINPCTYQISSVSDIQTQWFAQAQTVAVATGASTPLELVETVVKKISEIP